jgi:hypothetical protein
VQRRGKKSRRAWARPDGQANHIGIQASEHAGSQGVPPGHIIGAASRRSAARRSAGEGVWWRTIQLKLPTGVWLVVMIIEFSF